MSLLYFSRGYEKRIEYLTYIIIGHVGKSVYLSNLLILKGEAGKTAK